MWQAAELAASSHRSRAHRFFSRAVWTWTGVGLAQPWRGLPARVTFTTRLAANAVLYGPELPRSGRCGQSAWKSGRLGTAAEMAATAAWRRTIVTCYGVTEVVDLAVITCLWWGGLHRTPVRAVLVRDRTRHAATPWPWPPPT
jgi:hypothetical protein